MTVKDCDLGYPICDTDLWIKVCRINNTDVIFQAYKKIFISDAVNGEIRKKAEEDSDTFGCALVEFKKEYSNKRIECLVLRNDKYFNDIQRNYVYRQFKMHRINYDISKGEFTGRQKNLGEKITVIYAATLNVSLVLSDDSDCYDFACTHFPRIPVENLTELLNKYGFAPDEIQKLKKSLRTPKIKTPELGSGISEYMKILKKKK